ncbi:hypothetical protein O181_096383 [Austropuccinia psidii MF-1]|uniref:Uncharacterized protein n=1 Tax=Austropuccinia psidii MF-1 TaxID=1389203 RepID=A0A9Q3PC49_9BASI|nr:hypothetical protein [Austropuccinia psidii MF-1]
MPAEGARSSSLCESQRLSIAGVHTHRYSQTDHRRRCGRWPRCLPYGRPGLADVCSRPSGGIPASIYTPKLMSGASAAFSSRRSGKTQGGPFIYWLHTLRPGLASVQSQVLSSVVPRQKGNAWLSCEGCRHALSRTRQLTRLQLHCSHPDRPPSTYPASLLRDNRHNT